MPYRNRVLGLLFALSVINYLDRVCLSVAGPRMQKELNISPEGWGWVVGVFSLSYAAFEIPSGAWGDRLGPRAVLTRIVVWWSAFTTLTGTVTSYGWLLVTRFAFGAGEAGAFPNSAAVISRWFPKAERGRATGIMWMGSRLGAGLSAPLVITIQQLYGWRTSFYLGGLLGIAWAIVWYTLFRNRPSEKPGISPREVALIEEGVPVPLHQSLPWRIALRSRNFWYLLLMYHTYCWGSYFYLSWLHTFLQKGRGMTEDEVRIYGMFPYLTGAVCNVLGGVISDKLSVRYGLRFGRRVVGATGLAVSGVLLFATALTTGKMEAVLFLSLGYGAMDCMLPASWAVCTDIAKRYAGTVSGAMNMAGQIGSFLSTVAFGYMVTYFGDYSRPLLPFAAMLIVSAGVFLLIDPSEQLIPEKPVRPERPKPALAVS